MIITAPIEVVMLVSLGADVINDIEVEYEIRLFEHLKKRSQLLT
jgi:hypothetical protein